MELCASCGINEEVAGDNPFKNVGIDVSSASFGEQSGHTFVIASPGHPLCPRCRVPLAMPLERELRATTRCPSCNEEAMYELSSDAKQAYPGLQMVLAEGNRVDRASSAEAQVRTWWLLFSGPSPKRAAIEKRIRFGPETNEEEEAAPSSDKRASGAAKPVSERARAIWMVAALIGAAIAYELFVKEESKPAAETNEPAEPAPPPKSGTGHATHGGSH